jgi:hypothetical protein
MALSVALTPGMKLRSALTPPPSRTRRSQPRNPTAAVESTALKIQKLRSLWAGTGRA